MSRNAGFTLIELIVGLAVMVMLAAVVGPTFLAAVDRARIDRGLESIEVLVKAAVEFDASTDRFPGYVTQLVEPITTSHMNSCDLAYSNGEVNRWRGPYLPRMVPATGFPIPLGQVSNWLIREPATVSGTGRAAKKSKGAVNTASGTLAIEVLNVLESDAFEVNERVDNDGGNGAGGSIQFTEIDLQGRVTLYFVFPISGC